MSLRSLTSPPVSTPQQLFAPAAPPWCWGSGLGWSHLCCAVVALCAHPVLPQCLREHCCPHHSAVTVQGPPPRSAETPHPRLDSFGSPHICVSHRQPRGCDAAAMEATGDRGLQVRRLPRSLSPTGVGSPLPPDLQCQELVFQPLVLQLHGQQRRVQTPYTSAGGFCWHSRGCLSHRLWGRGTGRGVWAGVGAYRPFCPCVAPQPLSPARWPPPGGGGAGPGWPGRALHCAGRTVAAPCHSPSVSHGWGSAGLWAGLCHRPHTLTWPRRRVAPRPAGGRRGGGRRGGGQPWGGNVQMGRGGRGSNGPVMENTPLPRYPPRALS